MYFKDEATDEKEVLEKFSNPGLKRNTMTKFEKKCQLVDLKVSKEESNKILKQLFGV